MSEAPIAGLILAGGASRRMGSPKALLRIEGETFIDRLAGVFAETLKPVIVVLGHEAETVRQGMETRAPVVFTVNPDPERGMLSSLQCGLRELPADVEGVLFSPVDYPNCQRETVGGIVARFRAGDCDVVIPVCRGKHGHPVCVSKRVVTELLGLPSSAQAPDVIRRYRDRTAFLEVQDSGITADVDTPEDYRKLVAL